MNLDSQEETTIPQPNTQLPNQEDLPPKPTTPDIQKNQEDLPPKDPAADKLQKKHSKPPSRASTPKLTPRDKKKPTLIAVWPEFWDKIKTHFGTNGLYWFRDSPLITHWKKIENVKAWDFMLFEWLFCTRGKGSCNSPVDFQPARDEVWDFAGKPYVGQGCRFFRRFDLMYIDYTNRDSRKWIKRDNSSGIFRNLGLGQCPPEVLVVLKQILAVEQNFDLELFEGKGLLDLPPPGTDLEKEAEDRLNILISFYDQEEEKSLNNQYWLNHEDVQQIRKGTSLTAHKSGSEKPVRFFAPSEPKPRRKRKTGSDYGSGCEEEEEEHVMEEDVEEEDYYSSRINKMIKEDKVQSKKGGKGLKAMKVSNDGAVYVNVYSRSGKFIVKDWSLKKQETVSGLLDQLTLPELPENSSDKYVVCARAENGSCGIVFLEDEKIGNIEVGGDSLSVVIKLAPSN